ncbi:MULTISPECIES: hypothetical protein [Streptomyces]|uniref:Uncharacterized protein n=1 Tax=Streptomyces virginiae TaxID=1961 RepID=A0ABZ1TMX8_STRVG|nr:hypothetical protein [Streptomyces virginiae]WTB27234.1 hypothetical protein OG253_40475 [Streptomyces virginiae]
MCNRCKFWNGPQTITKPLDQLIVYPPDEQGWRRVRYDGVAIGVAHRPSDIRVFLADAGLENAEDVDLTDPDFVEW